MFIKMSGKWYCKQVDSLYTEQSNIESHCNNGELVVLADDIDGFAEEMQVDVDDIVMV
jgi:hypothetical protein